MENIIGEEFVIAGTDRYGRFIYVVWFGDYTTGVAVSEDITTKEELFELIRRNRPTVNRSTAPVFDLAEAIMEEHRIEMLPVKRDDGASVLEDLIREMEEEGVKEGKGESV